MEPPQPPSSDAGPRPPGEGAAADAPPEAEPTPPLSAAERTREARARRRRAIRQFLIVGLCFAALLCLGAVAVGFLYYDRATKPDLTSPVLSTHEYLSAYLIDRDDQSAERFQCSNASGLAEIRALRDDLDSREKTYGVRITPSVDRLQATEQSDKSATVLVDLVLSTVIDGEPQRAVQQWQFGVQNDGGWRVCSAHHIEQ